MSGATRFALLMALFAGLALPAPAAAACGPRTSCVCEVSATGVNFGNYNPLAAGHADSVGSVTVNCEKNGPGALSFTVNLSPGGSASYATRRMAGGGGSQLDYNLYRDAARSQIWGDGTGGSTNATFSDSTKNIQQTFSVYGRAFSGQTPTAGAYADIIVVTVVY